MSIGNSLNIAELIKDIKNNVTNNNLSLPKVEYVEEKPTKSGKRHFCDICSKGFAKKCGLKTHLLIHEGVKPFSCEICLKTFTKKCTLTVHHLTHTSDRPFVCELCEKSFARKSDLKKHNLVHTGEKPFLCNICDKSFTRRNTLKKHELTHFPKKPKTVQMPLKEVEESLNNSIQDLEVSLESSSQSTLLNDMSNFEEEEHFTSESNLSSIPELGHVDIYEDQFDELNPFLTNTLNNLNKDLLQSDLCEEDLYRDLSQMENLMFEYTMENINFDDGMDTADTETYTLPIVDSPVNEFDESTELDETFNDKMANIQESIDETEVGSSVTPLPTDKGKQDSNKENLVVDPMENNEASKLKNNREDEVAKIHKFLGDTSMKSSVGLDFICSYKNDGMNSFTSCEVPFEIDGINIEDIDEIVNRSQCLPDQNILSKTDLQNVPNSFENFHSLLQGKLLNINGKTDSIKCNDVANHNTHSVPILNSTLAININEICKMNNFTNSSSSLIDDSSSSFLNNKSTKLSDYKIMPKNNKKFQDSDMEEVDIPNDLIAKLKSMAENDRAQEISKKTHTCHVCGKSFAKRCSLKNHLFTHEKIKPFSCEICDKSFAKKCTLTVHLLTHATNRPFVCTVCQKSFVRKNDLTKHNFVHAEVKPHICKLCGRGYTQLTKLRKHHQLHHPNEPLVITKNAPKTSQDTNSLVNKTEEKLTKVIDTLSITESQIINGKIVTPYQSTEQILNSLNKQYKCNICNTTFLSQNLLQIHLMTHIKIPMENIDKFSDFVKENNQKENLKVSAILAESGMIHSKEIISNDAEVPIDISQEETTSTTTTETIDFQIVIDSDQIINDSNSNSNNVTREIRKAINGVLPKDVEYSKMPNSGSEETEVVLNFDNSESSRESQEMYEHNSILMDKSDDPIPNSDIKEQNKTKSNEVIKNHTCDICSKKFASKSGLKTHYLIHANVKPYICEVCYKTFAKKCSLTIHSLTHTGERPFVCGKCDKRFARRNDLAKHNLIHTGEKPYICNICEKKFSHQNNLKRHIRIHTGEKPHVCNICRKAFAESKVLLTHLKQHIKEAEITIGVKGALKSVKDKLHTCDVCSLSFARRDRLLKHKLTHNAASLLSCNSCNLTFKTRDQLQSHLLNHMEISFDGIADSIDTVEDLDLHKLEPTVQNMKKTHACDLCFKVFASRKALKGHYITHTGERPHQCHICQKGFSQRITLKRHMVVHTGERPYTCDICKKTFTRKTSLRKHIIIHSQKTLF